MKSVLTIKNRGQFTFIPNLNYLSVINITSKVGGVLANSENQHEFSLENLHIHSSKSQEISKKSTEKSLIYAKLATQLFQECHLLTGNLLGNKGYAIGKKNESKIIKNYSYEK